MDLIAFIDHYLRAYLIRLASMAANAERNAAFSPRGDTASIARVVYLAASSRYDLIATVRGETIQDVAEFVSKRLSTLDNVIGTATSFILTHYKSGGVPFCDSDEEEEQRSMIL